jgi:hypothetical protein
MKINCEHQCRKLKRENLQLKLQVKELTKQNESLTIRLNAAIREKGEEGDKAVKRWIADKAMGW